jgi:hypothetical protein
MRGKLRVKAGRGHILANRDGLKVAVAGLRAAIHETSAVSAGIVRTRRPNEIAELRHRDASKHERRRVVVQGDSVQCAEGSPAASARAAALISECIGMPPHLSLCFPSGKGVLRKACQLPKNHLM